MKKGLILSILILLILPSVLAINIDIEKQDSKGVLIKGIEGPATFDIKVTNNGGSGNFEFYNLLGFSMAPKGTVYIESGETKEIELIIYPRDGLDYDGYYTFEYYIRASDDSEQTEKITLNLIELKDAFDVDTGSLSPESNSFNIEVSNKVNFRFNEINADFSSAFFDFSETFSLGPYEQKEFSVELDNEEFSELLAGFYTMNSDFETNGESAHIEKAIKFEEKDILKTESKDYGFFISTKTIKKSNEGNVVAKAETTIEKNIISRLFTTFSPEPNVVNRKGFDVHYTWTENLNPGESLDIKVKTNWIFPLILIFFVIAVVIIAKQYSTGNLAMRKKVSFVKAKGGEFALKVTILVQAKKDIERLTVMDRLPSLVKLYEKFGAEKPARIDEKNKKIEWELNSLEKGEKRILSYVIYSKVGVMGRFALPPATAIFESNGEIHETESNRAFFVAEQRKKDIEE